MLGNYFDIIFLKVYINYMGIENINQSGDNTAGETKKFSEPLVAPRVHVDLEKIHADMARERRRQAEKLAWSIMDSPHTPVEPNRVDASELFRGEDEAHARQIIEDQARRPRGFLQSMRDRLGI